MLMRVFVRAPTKVLEVVRGSLSNADVAELPEAWDSKSSPAADCLLIHAQGEAFEEMKRALPPHLPIVRLLTSDEPPSAVQPASDSSAAPCAHVDNASELQLAMRAAMLEQRVRNLVAELNGPWSHDARGALGVARLALKLLQTNGEAPPSIQKVENGVVRLGWMMERLPAQVALALDVPLAEQPSQTLFPHLESYVQHLKNIQSRRPIELSATEWAQSGPSQAHVPFLAGFAELAFKLSSARSKLQIRADQQHLEVECECSDLPAPWNVPRRLSAIELSRRDLSAPYRLVEAARFALATNVELGVEVTGRSLLGRAEF